MAAHDKVRWHPPLKAPAIEVIDLLSDSDSTDTTPASSEFKAKRDAYTTSSKAPRATDEADRQWRAPLKAPAIEFKDSFSQNVLNGMGDVLAEGEDVKARDASVIEGSDSDEDSQWSLYEDALGEDEDEIALHTSM